MGSFHAGKACCNGRAYHLPYWFAYRLVLPSCRVLKYGAATPCVDHAAYIATSATVSGDVSLGCCSSVGYGSTLRGISLCLVSYS